MYLFGDSTPFPLRENFIDTLVAAVDCCVELFELDEKVEAGHAAAREARRDAGDELRRLEALDGWIREALAPMLESDGSARVSEQTARRIAEQAREMLREARVTVVDDRDRAVSSAQPEDVTGTMRRHLASFLLAHQLPHTQWSWRWRADERQGRADLRAMASDLIATFVARGPETSQWAGPIRIAAVLPGTTLSIPLPPKRRRPQGEGRAQLDDYEAVEMDSTRSIRRIVLRPHKSRGDILLSLRSPETTHPFTQRLEDGRPVGSTAPLSTRDCETAEHLWARLSENADELIDARSELVQATLGNRLLDAVERPGQVAEALLLQLAPLVREMRLRSRVPGELILKRELGGERREELFVPRKALQERFADLPSHHLRVFEAMGLGSESTVEFAARVAEAPPSARPASPRIKTVNKIGDILEELEEAAELAESLDSRESYGFDEATTRDVPRTEVPGAEDSGNSDDEAA